MVKTGNLCSGEPQITSASSSSATQRAQTLRSSRGTVLLFKQLILNEVVWKAKDSVWTVNRPLKPQARAGPWSRTAGCSCPGRVPKQANNPPLFQPSLVRVAEDARNSIGSALSSCPPKINPAFQFHTILERSHAFH